MDLVEGEEGGKGKGAAGQGGWKQRGSSCLDHILSAPVFVCVCVCVNPSIDIRAIVVGDFFTIYHRVVNVSSFISLVAEAPL